MKKHKKKIVSQRLCVVCSKPFAPLNAIDDTCKRCRRVTLKPMPTHIEKVSVTFTKTCLQCGKPFETTTITKKYCSDICREEFNKDSLSKQYEVSKEIIFRRDGYRCIYCGASSIEDGVKLHLEHIYPISKGGREDLFNLATSCERCNTVKSATMLNEDVILRIWERNEKLNEKIDSKTYDEMMIAFRKNLKLRQMQ